MRVEKNEINWALGVVESGTQALIAAITVASEGSGAMMWATVVAGPGCCLPKISSGRLLIISIVRPVNCFARNAPAEMGDRRGSGARDRRPEISRAQRMIKVNLLM